MNHKNEIIDFACWQNKVSIGIKHTFDFVIYFRTSKINIIFVSVFESTRITEENREDLLL